MFTYYTHTSPQQIPLYGNGSPSYGALPTGLHTSQGSTFSTIGLQGAIPGGTVGGFVPAYNNTLGLQGTIPGSTMNGFVPAYNNTFGLQGTIPGSVMNGFVPAYNNTFGLQGTIPGSSMIGFVPAYNTPYNALGLQGTIPGGSMSSFVPAYNTFGLQGTIPSGAVGGFVPTYNNALGLPWNILAGTMSAPIYSSLSLQEMGANGVFAPTYNTLGLHAQGIVPGGAMGIVPTSLGNSAYLNQAFYQQPYYSNQVSAFTQGGAFDYRVFDNDHEYVIEASADYVDDKHLDLTVVGHELRVRTNGRAWLGNRSTSNSNYCSIPIPQNVNYSKITANIENNRLIISLPKYVEVVKSIQKTKAS